jgi:hypothetical protein
MAKMFYDSMMEGCYNQDAPRYKYYDALGCTVCDEWKNDFNTFYNDVKDDAGFMRSLELKTGCIYPAIRYEEDPIREFNKDSIAFLTSKEYKNTEGLLPLYYFLPK